MKTYKLCASVKLNSLREGYKSYLYQFAKLREDSNEMILEFYEFLRDIGLTREGGIEYFFLSESQYLELNLKFYKINNLFRIEKL